MFYISNREKESRKKTLKEIFRKTARGVQTKEVQGGVERYYSYIVYVFSCGI